MPSFISVITICFFCLVPPGYAQDVRAKHPIRVGHIITLTDLEYEEGAVQSIEKFLGMEAKQNIYSGQVINVTMVHNPQIIKRNQLVDLRVNQGALQIVTQGRALESGAVGDTIRVVNSSSRITVFGEVSNDGSVILN